MDSFWTKYGPILRTAAYIGFSAAIGYLAKTLGFPVPPLDVIGDLASKAMGN